MSLLVARRAQHYRFAVTTSTIFLALRRTSRPFHSNLRNCSPNQHRRSAPRSASSRGSRNRGRSNVITNLNGAARGVWGARAATFYFRSGPLWPSSWKCSLMKATAAPVRSSELFPASPCSLHMTSHAHYSALCVGYRVEGAELASLASHTRRAVRWRVRSCEDHEHTPLRQGRERAQHLHGWQRCGAEELCEPHLRVPT